MKFNILKDFDTVDSVPTLDTIPDFLDKSEGDRYDITKEIKHN
jgi:hypothetical protein